MKKVAVWIRVTVNTGRKAPTIDLLRRRPSTLALNQFAYSVEIQYEEDDWTRRLKKVELPQVRPPDLADRRGFASVSTVLAAKDVPTQVLDALSFEDGTPKIEIKVARP